ncbi:hypothetical protein SDC9_68089 [bioreactor metagenome]|uniref:Uncharacterized protein n=3 Tax=root TaxID=1 RepID=A0A644Y636_9ZZZZ
MKFLKSSGYVKQTAFGIVRLLTLKKDEMKKLGLLLTALIAIAAIAPAQKTGIIADVLKKSAEEKVARMQEMIGFDDNKARQLNELEFTFLLDVQKAENCCLCNRKKRIERLKQKRDQELQRILSRDEYIQYDAVENERIKKQPLWAE